LKLRPPELEIDKENPFTIDRLDRLEFGEALTELVKSTKTSFVLNIDASWGQGKTTFLRMWRQQLLNKEINCLYFNAWETDYALDPLVALIGELSEQILQLNLKGQTETKAKIEKVKKLGAGILKRSIPTAVKLATLGLVDLSDLEEDVLSSFSESIAQDQLRSYEQGKQSILGFRDELAALAKDLSAKRSENEAPLTVIIDELDRCRPDYAIKLLETVKHLFTVPNIFFVIATDSRQLASAVHHTYGLETSAPDYLRRFFDLTLLLPDADTKKFVTAQFERYGLDEVFARRVHPELRYDKEQAQDVLAALFKSTGCSLRDQEKSFTLLVLAVRATLDDHYLYPPLLCALIVLRVKNFDFYSEFVAGKIDHNRVIDYFSSTAAGKRFFSSARGYGAVVEASFIASRRSRYGIEDVIDNYKKIAADEKADEQAKNRAGRILIILNEYSFGNSFASLPAITKKIDLFARSLPDHGD